MAYASHTHKPPGAAEAPVSRKLLTTKEAASALQIGVRTLQERVSAREIAVVKIGKSTRFDPSDLDAFIQSKKLKATGWKGDSR